MICFMMISSYLDRVAKAAHKKMLLLFVVEFADGTVQRVPVSCDEGRPMSQAVSAIRQKLSIGVHIKVQFRQTNGAPMDLTKTPRQLQLETNGSVFAIVDANPSTEGSPSVRRVPSGERGVSPVGKVIRLGPQPTSNSGDSEADAYTDEDTLSEATANSEACGVHTFMRDGTFWKTFVKKRVKHGDCIIREEPILSVAYPMQLVETVRDNEYLRTRTYDPCANLMPTAVHGMDDATFTRYLSIAMTHGKILQTGDGYKKKLAFYPQTLCVRHSCSPNSAAWYQLNAPPYHSVVRCVKLDGLQEGDECSILLPAVDSVGFLLLPRERRHQHLQKKYHFTCHCERCEDHNSEVEQTLTGAYFNIQGHAAQKAISERMRDQFSGLNLLDEFTGLPTKNLGKGDAGKLCQFLLDYSGPDAKLQLHPNHWRLSLVRIAFLWHCVRGTLDQQCFDVAFQQLQTEARFIPRGHPLALPTYRRLKLMMSRLPPRLAATVQRKGLNTPGIEWDVLQRLDTMGFGSHSG